MQTKDSQKIIKRFFEALYALKRERVIRGKKTFTDRYDINRWNLNKLEKNLESDIFQPAWLTYLVKDFDISPTWLLMGTGDIFSTPPKNNAHRALK